MKDSRSNRKVHGGQALKFAGGVTGKGEPTCKCGFSVRKITRFNKAVQVMREHMLTCSACPKP